MSLSLMTLVIATTAFAQDAKLRRLNSGAEGSAWEAVGRLDLGGQGFCTGALIAPDLVLTAAHCLFAKDTGQRINHEQVEFLAGWRNGRASAYRRVRRAVVHPEYQVGTGASPDGVRNDVALLELAHPIRNGRIRPFETSERPQEGSRVGVVSYAKDRSEAPSLQEVCEVLGHREGMLVTSCTVDFGASGAPIFTFDEGVPEIVSVISAKAEMEERNVSLGTELDTSLQTLRDMLADVSGLNSNQAAKLRRIRVGADRLDTGAKFVKP